MKGLVVAVAAALGFMGLAAPPAEALPSRDLYMVRSVHPWDAPDSESDYEGQYYVVRKKGRNVVGQWGFLHYDTDNLCLTGTVSGHRYRFVARRGKEEPYNLKGKWVGSGNSQRVKGYQSVSRAQMQTYLTGRDPRGLIERCS